MSAFGFICFFADRKYYPAVPQVLFSETSSGVLVGFLEVASSPQ